MSTDRTDYLLQLQGEQETESERMQRYDDERFADPRDNELRELRLLVRVLASALQPFVHEDLLCEPRGNVQGRDSVLYQRCSAQLKLGDFRDAAAALDAVRTVCKPKGRNRINRSGTG